MLEGNNPFQEFNEMLFLMCIFVFILWSLLLLKRFNSLQIEAFEVYDIDEYSKGNYVCRWCRCFRIHVSAFNISFLS